jgi:hypothetical protein
VPEPDSTPDVNRPGEEPDDGPVLRSTRLPASSAPALDSSSEQREVRADELRDALYRLRTSLEGRPAATGGAVPDQSGRRAPSVRAVLLACAAVLAVAGLAVVAAAAGTARRETARRETVSAPPPSASSAPATPTPAAGTPSAITPISSAVPTPGSPNPSRWPSPSPGLTTRPQPWPGGAVLQPPGLPASGPGATAPGLELTAALDPDGRHVDVYERLVLRPGAPDLVLRRADLGRLAGALRSADGSVSGLQVELDGRAVRLESTGASWRAARPDGGNVSRAVIRYRLTRVFLRQHPAPPGRFTLVLRPLGAGVVLADHDPVVVRIGDARVGTMTCPTSRYPLCGSGRAPIHTATLPGDATGIVLAQVTQPGRR